MLGKLLGQAVGTVVAAPALIASEATEAVEAAAKTIDDAVERATEPKDARRARS